jgi:uncharacterized protein YdaU (DUF1376 family)
MANIETTAMHFMHLSLGDWADGIAGFTLEQEGFYLRLCRRLYAVDGRLLDDDVRNARRLNLDVRTYRRQKDFLISERKIEIVDGHIVQRRVLRDLAVAKAKRSTRAEQGRKGAEGRKLKAVQDAAGANSDQICPDFGATSPQLPAEVVETADEKASNFNLATMPLPTPTPSPNKKEPPTPKGASAEIREAFDAYNATAARLGFARAEKLTADRVRKIRARLDDYGLGGWRKALAEIERSPFLLGKTPHGFRVSLDFVCQPSSFGKLHDGGYSSSNGPRLQLLDFGDGAPTLSRYGGRRA